MWATEGQDRYRTIAKNYYKGSHGILLLYDVTKLSSFENIREWIKDIKEEVYEKAIIFLIGNKIDKTTERKITTEQGTKLAEEYNLPFFEASAKSGENVDEIFKFLYKKLVKFIFKYKKRKGKN